MKKYSLAVFDVDGTLLDTAEGIYASVKYTIRHYNLAPLSEDVMSTFIGPPIQNSFNRVYGIEGEKLQETANVFRNNYSGENLLKAKPYDGMYGVFEGIINGGTPVAIATYKRQDYAERIVRHFGFDRYTDLIYGADNENKLKKKDIVKLCLEKSGITDAGRAVMVGDSDNDAIAAQQLGMDFIAVTYGYGFHSDEDCAKFPCAGIAHTPEEILNYI